VDYLNKNGLSDLKNGLSDLKDESINKIAMVSCRSSFLWINGELLVGIYFGVLMESFL
jgi:hypothetical protein